MTNLQWGIVGLGGIAHSFAESFDQTTSTLTACASRTLEKAEKFADNTICQKRMAATKNY